LYKQAVYITYTGIRSTFDWWV